jgi:hypothetical protein
VSEMSRWNAAVVDAKISFKDDVGYVNDNKNDQGPTAHYLYT